MRPDVQGVVNATAGAPTRSRGPGGWTRRTALVALLAAGAVRAATRTPPVVLVVGDSLSAEYGLKRGSGWVALLANRLATDLPSASVVNASISGDTSAGGRARLPALLKQHRPTHVVVELGANDALRGLALAATRGNLDDMTTMAQTAGAQVVLVGIQVPPNYGRAYNEELGALYVDIARARHAALVPFLLHGVADVPEADTLFQADRLHPSERGHPAMLENVWKVLRPLLR